MIIPPDYTLTDLIVEGNRCGQCFSVYLDEIQIAFISFHPEAPSKRMMNGRDLKAIELNSMIHEILLIVNEYSIDAEHNGYLSVFNYLEN